MTSSAPSVVSSSGVAAAAGAPPTSDMTGVGRRKSDPNLAETWGVMSSGRGSAQAVGSGVQPSAVGFLEGSPLEANVEAVCGEVGEDLYLAFSDPAVRVFAFELNQVLPTR